MTDISELYRLLAQPAVHALQNLHITTLEELAMFSESDVLALHGIGQNALSIIKTFFQQRGLHFAAFRIDKTKANTPDETPRIRLRRLNPMDAEPIFRFRMDPANFPHVDMPLLHSLEEANKYIVRMNKGMDEGQWLLFGMELKLTGELIGTVSLWHFSISGTTAEIGFLLFPEHRGHGYMKEAIDSLISFAFERMGLQVLEAYTQVNNHSSAMVLQNSGFVFARNTLEEHSITKEEVPMMVFERRKK